jgi:hypothetical protein
MTRAWRFREWLARGLMGLLLAVSAAPCAAPAAPALAVKTCQVRPHDPCGPASSAAAASCVQLACQVLLEPAGAAAPDQRTWCETPAVLAQHHPSDRAITPVDPPPRTSMD